MSVEIVQVGRNKDYTQQTAEFLTETESKVELERIGGHLLNSTKVFTYNSSNFCWRKLAET